MAKVKEISAGQILSNHSLPLSNRLQNKHLHEIKAAYTIIVCENTLDKKIKAISTED